VAASILYNKFSDEYKNNDFAENSSSVSENEKKAPDFTVVDGNGNEVELSDFKGKPVVLNFWATWCYYCKQEMPDFNTAAKNHPEVQFLMVNATDGVEETVEKAKKYIEDEGFEFPVFFDTEMEAVYNYNVTGFPSTYLIDKNGNLVAFRSGMMNLATLEKGIEMITK
jgi:peroxiredoxin